MYSARGMMMVVSVMQSNLDVQHDAAIDLLPNQYDDNLNSILKHQLIHIQWTN